MTSRIVKRSVIIAGHKKSVSLEEAVWKSLKEIAAYQDTTLFALVAAIATRRNHGNLSSAIRLFVLNFYREQLVMEDRRNAIDAAFQGSTRGLH